MPLPDERRSPEQRPLPDIDTTVPHSARIWNHWLGGKDNYEVDRKASEEFRAVFPGIVDLARTSRYFLARAVRFLVGEAGIRQFLDLGTGLPTADNTHEVAQSAAPESRIVYVDNDPLVLAHARALLTSTPEGATDYIDADLHDPEAILRAAARTLDLDRPVALTLMQTLGHIDTYHQARSLVHRLVTALPSGSYLALNDSVSTHRANAEATARYNDSGAVPYHLRSPEEISGFFDGLVLVEPGVVPLEQWRPDVMAVGENVGENIEAGAYGGVGRKP